MAADGSVHDARHAPAMQHAHATAHPAITVFRRWSGETFYITESRGAFPSLLGIRRALTLLRLFVSCETFSMGFP